MADDDAPDDDIPDVFVLSFARFEEECQGAYRFVGPIGQGRTATVYSAVARESGLSVAVRVVPAAFLHAGEAKRALRELRILKALDHDNITRVLDLRAARAYAQFARLYVVVERMDGDLRWLVAHGPPAPDARRYVVYQACLALKFVHSANLLHRDIKPDNILVSGAWRVKLADFNLARVEDPDEWMTDYVAARWYRAPELLLNFAVYDAAVDMWSLGCVLAELILGRPLFDGRNTLEQIERVARVLGTPGPDVVDACVADGARAFVEALPRADPLPFAALFPAAPPDEIDFLENLLMWQPVERMTADQALRHPYFSALFDETEAADALPIAPFEFEGQDLTVEELKRMLWAEVCERHPDYESLA